jgi:hypothetical protein
MTTFKLPKKISDVQDQQLLPEDWYIMRLSQEPTVEDNKKMKDGGAGAEGAGQNIVLKMVTVSENPVYNGRMFTMWLPLPNAADRDIFFNGQSREDSKLERIAAVVSAFNGGNAPAGDEFELHQGDEALFYVTTETAYNDDSRYVNAIDGKQAPRPIM